ncbi:MAG: fluoride efflux transporter FluC [Sandaracinaceae bacterium]
MINAFAVVLLVAAGGATGALLRYGAGALGAAVGLEEWSATMAVNVLGSLAAGFAFVQLEARLAKAEASRLGDHPTGARLRDRGWLVDDPTLNLEERFHRDHTLRFASALIMTGFFGGLTTFSTFSLEVVTLLQHGAAGTALLVVIVSVIGAGLALVLGMHAALWTLPRPGPGDADDADAASPPPSARASR